MGLAYSFHLGNDGNKSKRAKAKSKNNLSGTTSYANNAIQNARQLSKVNNHDFRKYDGDTEYIYKLRGSGDVVSDVKGFYKNEFEEARLEYNSKQSRPSRMIDDYFQHVSDDEQKDLACEIIIELGNKEFWDTKDLDYKQKMVDVYNQQLNDLESFIPDFKLCSAVVHLDEGSPHMHVVGIPVKDNYTRGMTKQVCKSQVFTKDRLEKLQDFMREKCIETYNKVFGLEAELKEKQKGRVFNIHVKDMQNYNEIMKQMKVQEESVKKANDILNKFKETSKEVDEIFYDVEQNKDSTFTLSEKQMIRFIELTGEVQNMEEQFDKLKEIYVNLSNVKDNIEYFHKRNNDLIKNNDLLADKNDKLEKKVKHLEGSEHFLKSYLKKQKEDRLEMITYLCKYANSKDSETSRFVKQLVMNMNDKGVINDKEYNVIFRPPITINKSEINKALSSINKEMEEAAEEFYQTRNNDYEL